MNVLITGGAGFIGTNAAIYFLKKGNTVTVFDNLSRIGSTQNLKQTIKAHPKLIFQKGDTRNYEQVKKIVRGYDIIIHLAGQVAVTTSVTHPREDFEINALGTLNILEAVRISKKNPIILYSSTNKVYGNLESLAVVEEKKRYRFKSLPLGISEDQNLDFHSPYGCSKGAAEQYVHDYSRIYNLRTVVFRQSCIYGPFQRGVEDQGWVAWFLIQTINRKKINIFGNGKQVRDILYIDDLIEAYESAIRNIKITQGQIYNIGGGTKNTMSIWWEFKEILDDLFRRDIKANFSDWRPGDQKIFVSDTRKAKAGLKWIPQVGVNQGIRLLFDWLNSDKDYHRKK